MKDAPAMTLQEWLQEMAKRPRGLAARPLATQPPATGRPVLAVKPRPLVVTVDGKSFRFAFSVGRPVVAVGPPPAPAVKLQPANIRLTAASGNSPKLTVR